MSAWAIVGLSFFLVVIAAILWRFRERGFAVSFFVVAIGTLLNRLAVAMNGGHMPILGVNSDGARLVWLCDIFYIRPLHAFSFLETDVTVNSTDIGGHYSVGDFLIGAGILAIAVIVLRRVLSRAH